MELKLPASSTRDLTPRFKVPLLLGTRSELGLPFTKSSTNPSFFRCFQKGKRPFTAVDVKQSWDEHLYREAKWIRAVACTASSDPCEIKASVACEGSRQVNIGKREKTLQSG